MSEKINMSNYEAFYLDFLEGNLSGEALAAFEAFLLEHPELSVDESPMFTLEPAPESFDITSKLALKKGIDMADLTDETIEFFLIARTEGLLDADQKAQLNHWLEANAHYRQDADLYALVQLEADQAETFGGKEELKKPLGGGRVIPMWWTGVAVAAGLALLITISMNAPGTSGKDPVTVAGTNIHQQPADSIEDTNHSSADSNSVDSGNSTQQSNDQANNRKDREVNSTNNKQKRANDKQPATPKRRPGAYQRNNILLHETVIASLEKRRATINTGDKTISPMPVVPKAVPVVEEAPSTEDMAWVPIDQMKNPIQPVTSRLSTTLNTPVDFRTAKAAKRKGGGFFIKFGKIEVSRQPGTQSASLD